MPSPATLKVPGTLGADGVAGARPSGRCSWRNCSRASKPSTVGIDRQPEVRRERADHVRADHVGAAQHRDPDVGAAAGEAADVALDLGDVLGVAGPRAARRGSMSSVNIAGSRLLAP